MFKKIRIISVLIAAAFLIFPHTINAVQASKARTKEVTLPTSIFSWHSSFIGDADDETEDEMFDALEKTGATVLYQYVSKNTDNSDTVDFLKRSDEKGVSVYLLDGDASWALEHDGESMIHVIERAAEINSLAEDRQGFIGVIFDVEPYQLDEWDTDRAELMNTLVSAVSQAYRSAKSYGLEMIMCIPYFYDTKGYTTQLGKLIKNGCDTVAVMNYYQGSEIKHLTTEVSFAKKYGKSVITIYELHEPGTHGLIAKNTYYDDGFDSLLDNWQSIRSKYTKIDIGYSLHDMDAVIEML